MIQVEDDVLQRMEESGRGRIDLAPAGDVEYMMLNHANPWVEVDGERSSPTSKHPFLLDPAVRTAIAHLVDRESVQRFVYGRAGTATPNFLNQPAQYNSQRKGEAFSVAQANALLDAAGWVRGRDGIRGKNGQRLKMLFQTSTNAPRQKVQAIFKQAAQAAGIEVELKATVATVFFSADIGNPDTNSKFQADLQMFTVTRGNPDPGRFMELFCSWLVASKANKWLGRNITRWRNDEYDRVFRAAESELHAVVPLIVRSKLTATANKLQAPISGWAAETSRIFDWYRSG
jgi:peptide/nickel transport system substrate-binding protein